VSRIVFVAVVLGLVVALTGVARAHGDRMCRAEPPSDGPLCTGDASDDPACRAPVDEAPMPGPILLNVTKSEAPLAGQAPAAPAPESLPTVALPAPTGGERPGYGRRIDRPPRF